MTAPAPSRWLAEHLARLSITPASTIPRIDPQLPRPLLPGLDLWDMWPLQERDGNIARIDGAEIWFILSAPQLPDPDHRHRIARIRLVEHKAGQWIDHGDAFADGFTPGSREWAGCAVRNATANGIDLYFTAAGEQGDARDNWAQRIFACSGEWRRDGARLAVDWQAPDEVIHADGLHYQRVTANVGQQGFIKGFRDPAWFADPLDGTEYLLFTASLVGADSPYDGAIGCAVRATDGTWQLRPPLLAMDGVNNEPERPHIVWHAGRYYLFWSTQTQMFAPGVNRGPNGLYAMVADSMAGPWRPLNGSGLVAGNPPQATHQAYSWWVTADLKVYGFADLLAGDGAVGDHLPSWRRAHFGGVPAPVFQLALTGNESRILAD